MNFSELKQLRPDLAFIAHWITPQSRVLDVGCGDGVMLDYLQTDKTCLGYGIEIADDSVLACAKRGVQVIQQDMEQGLGLFDDQAFAHRYRPGWSRGDRFFPQLCLLAASGRLAGRAYAGVQVTAFSVV